MNTTSETACRFSAQ